MRIGKPRVSGTREELAKELDDASTGWRHFGKDKLSEQASKGADELRDGADEVTVGHTTYEVDE
ncbi:hypothetical protein [Streptomyces sp. NPDC007063]|uniref:hypothetical protein n=1 Tax=Streptomyces sp. NPDC007063 TaxID=3364772 RepID=UPI0036C1922B